MELPGHLKWLALLPGAALIACYGMSRRGSDDVPPMQLILSPQGRIALVHPSASTAAMLLYSAVSIGILGVWVVCVLQQSPRATVLILLIVYLTASLIAVAWHRRKNRRHPPPRATLALSGQPVVLEPWKPDTQLTFKPRRPGVWLLTISTKPPFFSWRSSSPPFRIDADLSDERIRHIASQMATWPVQLAILPRKK
jgi:hypothetical protein